MKKIIKMLGIALIIGFSVPVLANNEGIGTVVGGIAGGLIGNGMMHGSDRAVGTIGGAMIGGLIGNQMGQSVDEADNYRRIRCVRHSHWDSRQYPSHDYPIRYSNTFIGYDGRLCRHTILTDEYGDRISAVFCCYHMSPNGYCTRWIRMR